MPRDTPLPPPGWYPDPYQPGSQRWFDGSVWTNEAMAPAEHHPDGSQPAGERGSTAESLRSLESFPGTDPAVAREGEPAYDGGGGWQGLYANRVGRGVMRAGIRLGPVHPARWLGGIFVVLALLTWGDRTHRIVLAALALISLVATIVVGVRAARERAYWRDVGQRQ